ncbi:MAG: histidine phosphatase family protein [Planctomycetota bacterium]|nr:histidine phosphatase family protein [Planctomycetota bacterium]
MELVIFRHGAAEDVGPDGDDASRRLTPEGQEKTLAAAQGLAAIIDRPSVILASPKMRAMQTAKILGQVFKREPVEMALLAEGSPPRLAQAIGRREEPSIMVVGHEPTLSELAANLLTCGIAHSFIELKKAGCIVLEVPVREPGVLGPARLMMLATSKMLRAIAGAD